jgi:AraC-like DNA-binding protein
LVHLPPRVRHRIIDSASEPLSLYGVCYEDTCIVTDSSLLPRTAMSWRLRDIAPHLAAAFRSDYREMLFEQWAREAGWETVLRSRLSDLLVRVARMDQRFRGTRPPKLVATGSGARRVATYLARLESGPFVRDTLDVAARVTGLSRRRFSELFRAVAGQSWLQRVQRLRIEHARKLLKETDKPIVAVAFESGFDDPSHFHRVFKRVVGRSPLAERNQFAKT